MKKYVAELLGTFFLVLTFGCCLVNPVTGVVAPLAIGAIMMTMVFAGAHISGAHYNPAVSLAVAVRGKLPWSKFPGYVIAQFFGAGLASYAVSYMKGDTPPAEASSYTLNQIAMAEFLYTFALAYVVLNVATAKATAGNSFSGLAIGFTVAAGAFAVGPISGGAFNPAVALGAWLLDLIPTANLPTYLIVQSIAGVLAGLIFRILNPSDR